MRAVRFDDFGQMPYVTDVPVPEPPDGGLVVRVEATGLCRSDWHGWQGHDPDITLPHVPGHELAEADDADAFYRAILSERCCMTDVASRPVSSLMGPAGFDRQTLWSTFYFLSGLHSVDRICLLDRMTELVGAARLPTHRRMAAVSAWQSKAENVPRHRILLHVFLSAVDRSCITDLNHVAQVRAARAGLAVERYRLAHGRYPETLDALVPEFLDAVPEDPFDGKPLRYQARANGFVVYSVGHDLADNGGRERDVAGASRVFGGSPALVRPYPPGSDVTFAVGPQPEPALSLPAGGPPR